MFQIPSIHEVCYSAEITHALRAYLVLLFMSHFTLHSQHLFIKEYNFPALQMKKLGAKKVECLTQDITVIK